ncbi:MATE family efflux transporter [Ruegeria sediminis]|uniref:MATE family efflux transporter n=2 Tax=Ruegeria sediminis TaxID=2583820 RepID=A0ABY2X017_9RHOB|nr:MATE family efflux transporter [Ruegeria sediminis]
MGHVVRMTLAGAMGITFVFLVDAANLFWIAKLQQPRLMAAIGFAFAIQFLSVSVGIGLMIAATALISRRIGEGRRGLARRQATSAMFLAFLIQSAVGLLILAFRHQIVSLSGAEGETAALAARYLSITVPSLGIMAAGMIANGALRAEGDAMRSMSVTLASGGVAMVIDPILIYVLEMGLDGAAYGVVLFRFVMFGMAIYFATVPHDLLARPRLRDCLGSLRPYLLIAVPAILTQLAAPVGNYILTTVMAPFGDQAMAGWAVVGRLTVVAFGGIFSLAGAIGGIFGQNYGAREFDRVRCTYRDSILFGLGYTLVMWAILFMATPAIAGWFALPDAAVKVLAAFTVVGAGGFVFASLLFVSNAAFNALGRARRATMTNWTRDVVLTLPAAIWLASTFGAPGVIYAQALCSLIVGLAASFWGWRYVGTLGRETLPKLDLAPPRSYAHPDRFRRR